jgi:hypothetical protein
MSKNRNKAVLSKAVSRYMAKHYKIIWVRRELRDKIRDVASKVGRSVPEFIYELFNRYGGKLVEELLAEGSKSAQATMHAEAPPRRVEAPKVEATTRAKPEEVVPEPGFVVIDMGVLGRFKVREEDWALLTWVVESTREYVSEGVIKRLPAHLHGLFRHMWKWSIVKYNAKAGRWMVDYSKLRVIRAR